MITEAGRRPARPAEHYQQVAGAALVSDRMHIVWAGLLLLAGPDGCPQCELTVGTSGPDQGDSTVGDFSGTLYSGAYTNQLYLPCQASGASDLYQYWYGDLGQSNWWSHC